MTECRARKLQVSHAYVLQIWNSMLGVDDPRCHDLGANGLTNGILAGFCRRIGLDSAHSSAQTRTNRGGSRLKTFSSGMVM